MPRLAPPCFGKVLSMAAEKGEIPNTLTFSIPMGGQSGTLNIFFKSVTYWPTLSKFRGGPVKKITLYLHLYSRYASAGCHEWYYSPVMWNWDINQRNKDRKLGEIRTPSQELEMWKRDCEEGLGGRRIEDVPKLQPLSYTEFEVFLPLRLSCMAYKCSAQS